MNIKNSKREARKSLPVDVERIRAAAETLREYRAARRALDLRLDEDEDFWKLRHWKYLRREGEEDRPEYASAWMFSSICNKHADMMDSLPGCECFARESGDIDDAEMLSKIIPVITERCGFFKTYSDNCWYKLKHGTAAYGVFWNNALENGLGDVDIRKIDLHNLYWEPGVTDIQDSRNLFIVSTCDKDFLPGDASKFETARTKSGEKAVVTDWYYKTYTDGAEVLHYCKFSGDAVLFASENLPEFAGGWYAHGKYPVVLDRLYPEEGSALGFGLISVSKDPQMYIDRLDNNLMEYLDWASHVRFWAKKSLGVNEDDFCDVSKRIVEVEGDIDEEKLKQITIGKLDTSVVDVRRLKVDELKETLGNRDVSQGTAYGGVTAASAILALQEAGNKGSRDAIATSYNAYESMVYLIIELIRQFYTEPRWFRILGKDGENTYKSFSNAGIICKTQEKCGMTLGRRPIFDVVVSAKSNAPAERLSRNNFARELYDSGMFKPENTKEALMALELMDFDGIEKVRAMIRGERSV